MNRSINRKWIFGGVAAAMVTVAAAVVIWVSGSTARPEKPKRALDMWGVEHDLTTNGWTLFDFVHVAGCGYCVLNAAAYQENFGDALAAAGVRTFGVDVYESQRDLIDYIKHHDIRFPVLTEPDVLWSALRCPGLPGQSLFHGDKREWGASQTLTFRNYDRIRRSVGALRPFRPAGPLKKALNSVFEDEHALVVVGDDLEADARRYFSGLRKIVFRIKRARDVDDADLAAGSVYVMGTPAENAFHERLSGRTPFRVDAGRVAFADTVVTGDNVLLWYCCPNPWNTERYLIVTTGTGPSLLGAHYYDGSQDFTIARRTDDGVIPIATGICDKTDGVWSVSNEDIMWVSGGDPMASDVMACGPRGCEAPVPTGTATPQRASKDEPAQPSPVAPQIDFSWSAAGRFVALSASADGACWAAWDRPGEGVFAGRLDRDGCRPVQVWAGQREQPGSGTPVDAFKPTIAAESTDGAWLAWSERTGGAYGIYAARLLGAGASDVWKISGRSNLDNHAPAIAIGDSGRVWLAWYAWEANARRPYARAWTGAGWTPVSAIPTADDSHFAWYLSGTTAGDQARFAWMQHYPDLTGIVTAAAAPDGWSEPQVLARSGRYPSIAYDATKNETRVVWQHWDSDGSTNDRYVWSIITSSEHDGRWSEPAPLPRCPDGRNETPVVCVDGSGCTWVFWSHKDRDVDGTTARWQIACEIFDHGTWHGPYIVSDPGVDARSPSAASSGAVWVGWHEGLGKRLDVRVKRIRAWNQADEDTVGTSWATHKPTKNL